MPRSGGSRAAPGLDALLLAAPAPGLKAGPVKGRPGIFPHPAGLGRAWSGLAGSGLAGPGRTWSGRAWPGRSPVPGESGRLRHWGHE